MKRLMIRMILTLTLLLGAGAATAGLAVVSAQEPGAVVNGVAVCPPGLSSGEIDATACTEPAEGVEYYAANPNTDNVAFDTTGGDGIVRFPLDQFAIGGPDGVTVETGMILGSNPYGEVSGAAASCTLNGEAVDAGLIDSAVQPGGASLAIQLTVVAGDQVACEWYFSPVASSDTGGDDGSDETGDDGDDAGGTDTPPVTELPETGTGMTADAGRAAGWLAGTALVALAGALRHRVAHRRSSTIAG